MDCVIYKAVEDATDDIGTVALVAVRKAPQGLRRYPQNRANPV